MTKSAAETNAPSSTDDGVATLHVLGGLDLRDNEGQPLELKARKNRQLLAYLAVPSGQVRSRQQLAALLWSDRQEEQARGSLRTALSAIRRAIGDDALTVEHDTVSLHAGYLKTDFDHLERLKDGDVNISKLESFYPGEFLTGYEHDSELYMEWLRGLRSECVDMALTVLELNAERLASAGNHKPAIDLMRQSLSLEPLKEQTHRSIMKLYVASGEKAMALAQFRTCKEVLLHELNAEPDPETRALADSIALRDVNVSEQLRQRAEAISEISAPTIAKLSQGGNNISTAGSKHSIAILPFVNMSGDAEQKYFADGITEDIITDLSSVSELSVSAKNSSQMYRGAPVSTAQISQELGVRYILEGSVRKSQDDVRITTQLMDAQSNLQIWAERYDRKFDNIFQLQSEISRAIVDALKINLVTSKQKATNRRTTTNVEAYQYFLRGQVSYALSSRRGTEAALSFFKQAIELDPNYALAYTGAANCATMLSLHYNVGENLLEEALDYSNEALRINPALAEAYSALGSAQLIEKNFNESKKNLEKAITLAPNLVEAHRHYGNFHLSTAGGVGKAYYAYRQAFALGKDVRSGMMLLTCLHGLDQPDETHAVATQVLSIAQRQFSLDPHNYSAANLIAFSLLDLGKTTEALHWANVSSAFDIEDGALAYNMACLHSRLGSIDEALLLLEKTLNIGCNDQKIQFMKYTDPDLNLVRQDPRFDELIGQFKPNI